MGNRYDNFNDQERQRAIEQVRLCYYRRRGFSGIPTEEERLTDRINRRLVRNGMERLPDETNLQALERIREHRRIVSNQQRNEGRKRQKTKIVEENKENKEVKDVTINGKRQKISEVKSQYLPYTSEVMREIRRGAKPVANNPNHLVGTTANGLTLYVLMYSRYVGYVVK